MGPTRKIHFAGWLAIFCACLVYRSLGEILPELAADVIGFAIISLVILSVTEKRQSIEGWVLLGVQVSAIVLLKYGLLGRW